MKRTLETIKVIYYSLGVLSALLTILGILGPKFNLKWVAWLQNTISLPIWGLLLYSLILIMMIQGLRYLYTTTKQRQDLATHKLKVSVKAEYRRERGRDTWHWCVNCSTWPTSNYEVRYTKPTTGELCNACKAKERAGTCKKK